MLQLLAKSNDRLSNVDLAQLAQWASERAKEAPKEFKRGYSLLREGADLLLREYVLQAACIAAWTSKNPSMADLMQGPKQSTQPIHGEGKEEN
jgi:hypothetical protein